MTVETSTTGILVIIAVMAVVTLATRWGGVFVMSFVRINPRIESFINTMASSVLIAIIVPMAFGGDAIAALATTTVIMLASRRVLPAISGGIAAAALIRFLVG